MCKNLLFSPPQLLLFLLFFTTTKYDAKTRDQIQNGTKRRVADDCKTLTFETQIARSTARTKSPHGRNRLIRQTSSPKDRKEPRPGSISDKRLTVSARIKQPREITSSVFHNGQLCTYVWTFPCSAASLHVNLPNPVVSRYAVFRRTSVSVYLL